MTLEALAAEIRASRGLAHKRDIAGVVGRLAPGSAAVPVGDDCAAIPDGDGWLLFAIEGFMAEFVAAEPWFAGYCGVMVNVSDIAAMGGRPIAVVDALWSRDGAQAGPILDGLAAGAATYGVPVVGGHSNSRNGGGEQLAAAILGRARRLLTSFDAAPGDRLLAAIDLRGRYRGAAPWWDASSGSPPARLRSDLELLPALAEAGLCRAAKDISMAGTLGTALMLLECSGLGARLDPALVPRPPGVEPARWLTSFPSFGFLLSVAPGDAAAVIARFAAADIACAAIGTADGSRRVRLADGMSEVPLWDFAAAPLIGCGPAPAREAGTAREVAHA